MTSSRNAPAVAIAVLLLGLLAACVPSPAPQPGPSSASPTDPTPEITATAAPTDGAESPEPEPGLDASDREAIRAAISGGDPAALEGYFSDPVRVIFMASECCFDITPAGAVEALGQVSSAPGPWDFDLPAATLEFWRSNQYYGYLFTGDDISGRAADGTIVNLGIEGDRITTVLLGFEEGFTH